VTAHGVEPDGVGPDRVGAAGAADGDGALDPAGDRWEIRQLVERYAAAADNADGAAAAAVFADDGELIVWLDPRGSEPTGTRRGRAEIAAAVDSLRRYRATHHAIASSVVDFAGGQGDPRAVGVTRCTAHHLSEESGGWRDHQLVIRYDDEFARIDGRWRIVRRELRVQWANDVSVSEPPAGDRSDQR
jgi:ketosteroid isomerase-like protein